MFRRLGQIVLLLRLVSILLRRAISHRARPKRTNRSLAGKSAQLPARSDHIAGKALNVVRRGLDLIYLGAAPVGRFLGRRWPAVICLLLAIGFSIATLGVRLYDGRTAAGPQINFNQQIGVFADGASVASLTVDPEPALLETGGQLPEHRWTVEVEPGEMARGRIVLVLLSNRGLWHINVIRPIEVTMALPIGAVLEDSRRTLRVDSEGTCASWYDGSAVRYARLEIEHSAAFGTSSLHVSSLQSGE